MNTFSFDEDERPSGHIDRVVPTQNLQLKNGSTFLQRRRRLKYYTTSAYLRRIGVSRTFLIPTCARTVGLHPTRRELLNYLLQHQESVTASDHIPPRLGHLRQSTSKSGNATALSIGINGKGRGGNEGFRKSSQLPYDCQPPSGKTYSHNQARTKGIQTPTFAPLCKLEMKSGYASSSSSSENLSDGVYEEAHSNQEQIEFLLYNPSIAGSATVSTPNSDTSLQVDTVSSCSSSPSYKSQSSNPSKSGLKSQKGSPQRHRRRKRSYVPWNSFEDTSAPSHRYPRLPNDRRFKQSTVSIPLSSVLPSTASASSSRTVSSTSAVT